MDIKKIKNLLQNFLLTKIEVMDKITKVQFDKFLKLQRSGKINMTDIVGGAKLIDESEDVYETIIWNYRKLKGKFENTAK